MLRYLKSYFGYDSFRPLQQEIITHILAGHDCLALMPTGGGKSICFQLSALMIEGTALVVSPLISLMKDQVEALRANGIAAAALNSTHSEEDRREVGELLRRGKLKLLYVSPEKLMAEKDFLLKATKINLLVIDEAHCISQWGHDFRPEYTQLGALRAEMPDVPMAAFTATADKITRNDIVEQLCMRAMPSGEVKVFVSSFNRPNLSLDVRRGYSADEKLRVIVDLIRRHSLLAATDDDMVASSGIVYCLSRKTTDEVARKLRERGVDARPYHAGMSAQERNRVQDDFVNDRVPVVCATIAFGMGIDKSNVRFVVHYNLPKSIEGFYQEIGRGGRDGLPCETILFYNVGDLIALRSFADGSAQREINNEKLDRMQEYAESQVCRRRILLNYFSESMDYDCGNCDVCKHPPKRFDGTVLVQKALSAIVRTGERAGFRLVVDILRGNYSPTVREHDYDKLKTFGVGRDVPSRDWHDYLLQMLQLGLLEIDYRDDSHLKVTAQGRGVLFEGNKVWLAVVVREDLSVKGWKKRLAMERQLTLVGQHEDAVLFGKLRRLRLQIASSMGLAPYMVFSDKTLHAMATQRPVVISDFENVNGVGEHKLRLYGKVFVKLIREHQGLDVD
ncbi:MAG: DNA helicase RecQ [Bacteroidales bacterium]|nr:DNA helicase RecQ [Bacteroidales bacterium]